MNIMYTFRVREIQRLGYELCLKTKYWWNKELLIAVSDETVRQDWSNFKNNKLVGMTVHDHVFFSYKKMSHDVNDTIYNNHFDVFKIPDMGDM